ncbi:MAG TPA: choice-of-anchor X domain-containing protein [Burkholderiaceae bacterium]|nr:choice-of-anchor X domain-containing protein [Burkholderiaceae bacterium]
MSRRLKSRSLAALLMAAMAAPYSPATWAGNNALSAVADVNTLDYVVNVDWDYDSPPTQNSNPSQVLDRNYITSVLRQMAQSKFTMTEGRHRLGTVYVYKNAQFGNNVDIRLLNVSDRSNANLSGWGKRNFTSFNYVAMDGRPETIQGLGQVITHELGHYTYGLFDEYREDGKALDPNDPGSPSGVDTPKSSIMHDQYTYGSLSLPSDYADPNARQTAQARAMGKGTTGLSAWEMLTRTPDQDPDSAQGYGRTFFEAFRGMDANTLQLTKPTAGFDAKFNVVFVANPVFRDVILVDLTLPKDRLDALIQAAKALVAQAKDNVRYAIVAFPSATDGVVLGATSTSIEGKAALSAALDGLAPNPNGVFDTAAAFTRARTLIDAERQVGDPATVHFLTGTEAVVPAQTVADIRAARVAVNPLGLTGATAEQKQARRSLERRRAAGATVSLTQVADATGGSYNSAKNGADAAKDATKAVNEAHANPYATMAFGLNEPLKAGASFDTPFRVAGAATDGEVAASVYFDPADAAKLSFALVDPSGKVHASSQLPQGVTFNLDGPDGSAEFTLAADLASRAGVWTVRVTANAATTDWVSVDVAGLTRVALSAQVVGGTVASRTAPVLVATLGGDKRIKGAVVTATVVDENGNVVLDNLTLADDGVAPDQRAGDGQYSLSLAGKLKAGEYYVEVRAETNAGSRTASLGALVKGTRDAELPVDLMERITEADFELEANALGVVGATTPTTPGNPSNPSNPGTSTSSGGGCTVNPQGDDAGLLLLLGAGLAGWALRRRTLRTRRV